MLWAHCSIWPCPHQPDLESFRSRLLAMGSYAVEMRYDDELYPTNEEISSAIEVAREFQQKILSLIPPQKPKGK